MRSTLGSVVVTALVVLSLSVLASAAQAADKVPNPGYKHWAQFKVGSFAKSQSEMKMKQAGDDDADAAQQMPKGMTMTQKLVDLTPEQAVVEITMSMNMQGREMTMPAHRTVIPAMIDADKADTAVLRNDPKFKGEVTDVKQGEEDVTVMGKSLPCHWVSATVKSDGHTMQTKVWTNAQVPGGMVKNEMHSAEMDNTMTLVAYEAK